MNVRFGKIIYSLGLLVGSLSASPQGRADDLEVVGQTGDAVEPSVFDAYGDLDTDDGRLNWGGFPHLPPINLPLPTANVSLCGREFAVSLALYGACQGAISTVASCETVVTCGPAIAFAAKICQISADGISDAARSCLRND